MWIVLLVEFLGIMCYEICYNFDDGTNHPGLVYMCFMMICLRISGGHLNPAVTLGVYMEQLDFKKNAGFAISIALVQFLGAFCGLCFSFMLRAAIPSETEENKWIFVPDQYPIYPNILENSQGLPAYGQVFLAETIGTMFFVMLYLTGKYEITRGRDPFAMIVCIIIGWIGLTTCLVEVSGAIFNPAIALAQILWQEMTYKYDSNYVRYWTFEYAISYMIGPLLGGFLGGNLFNQIKMAIAGLEEENNRTKSKMVEEI